MENNSPCISLFWMYVLSSLCKQQEQFSTKRKKLIKNLVKGSQTWSLSSFAQILQKEPSHVNPSPSSISNIHLSFLSLSHAFLWLS